MDEEETEEEGTPSSYLCGSVGGCMTNGVLRPSIACPYCDRITGGLERAIIDGFRP